MRAGNAISASKAPDSFANTRIWKCLCYPPGKYFFYRDILQVPIYIVFNPLMGKITFHRLCDGHYRTEEPNENGRYWIDSMELFLGTWQGEKEGRTGYWLRWWDSEGNLLPWAVEQIELERQQKERLAAYLQSQGIDPENLPEQ